MSSWRALDIKAVVDIDDRSILSMVACLTDDDQGKEEITEPNQGLSFVREIIPIGRFDEFLNKLVGGTCSLGQEQFSSAQFTNPRFQNLQNTPAYGDLFVGWPEFGEYQFYELHFSDSPEVRRHLNDRDLWAIARVLGFQSFDELTLHRVGFRLGGDNAPRIRIFAPILAHISIHAGETEAMIHIEIHHNLAGC